MKYAVEMGSGSMLYMSSAIKSGSVIQKLIGGYIDTDRMVIALAYFYFFEIREVG
jgi:hypothetical protein